MNRERTTVDEYLEELRVDAERYATSYRHPTRLAKRLRDAEPIDTEPSEWGTKGRNYRKIWERHFKVEIPEGYHVHHKDKDRSNADPTNLLCLPAEEHIRLHEMKGDREAVRMLMKSYSTALPKDRPFRV